MSSCFFRFWSFEMENLIPYIPSYLRHQTPWIQTGDWEAKTRAWWVPPSLPCRSVLWESRAAGPKCSTSRLLVVHINAFRHWIEHHTSVICANMSEYRALQRGQHGQQVEVRWWGSTASLILKVAIAFHIISPGFPNICGSTKRSVASNAWVVLVPIESWTIMECCATRTSPTLSGAVQHPLALVGLRQTSTIARIFVGGMAISAATVFFLHLVSRCCKMPRGMWLLNRQTQE